MHAAFQQLALGLKLSSMVMQNMQAYVALPQSADLTYATRASI